MSKGMQVVQGVKTLIANALTAAASDAVVLGLDGSDAAPDRIGGGRVLVEYGEPGKPTIDLSPVTYNYEHQIPVTIEAADAADVDAILDILSAAIAANRFLGGMVDYLDATAPDSFDETDEGAVVVRVSNASLTATYSTNQPL